MKPGWKSTEFWLTVAAVVLSALGAVYAPAEWARVASMIGGALTTSGYSLSRGMAKKQ